MKSLSALLLSALPAMAQDLPPGLESARLLPGWVTPEGHRITALEIRLLPGWKTYWRSPGDAGVPPRFDWQDAPQLGQIDLHWPRPEVIDSGGERTLGYHDGLILPIEMTPPATGALPTPAATVDFGVCLDICVPVQMQLTAPPPGDAPDPRIEAAMALEPREMAQKPQCRVRPIRDGMRLTATLPLSQDAQTHEVAMELTDPAIWVSTPETRIENDHLVAEADFIDSSGKPFALDAGQLRLTLIGADDAAEARGCASVGD